MPDLLVVFAKRWKFILTVTVLALVIGFIMTLLSPKKYLSTATALPANTMTADKARLFNENIEALYSDFGAPEELDRIEGTATLDTIYIAAANELDLASHYSIKPSGEAVFKAAMELRKNSRINRSGYGELQIRVWDKDRNRSALIANTLLKNLQLLHQRLQNENNLAVLQKINEAYGNAQHQFRQVSDSLTISSGSQAELLQAKKAALSSRLQEYEKMSSQYQLAVNASPQVLLTVENARAPLWPDRSRMLPTILLCGFVAFLSAFLIAFFVENRKASR